MGMGMYGSTYRGFGQYGMNGLPDVNDEHGYELITVLSLLVYVPSVPIVSVQLITFHVNWEFYFEVKHCVACGII